MTKCGGYGTSLLLGLVVVVVCFSLDGECAEYGVDISFPMHKRSVSENYEYLPHNQKPSIYPTPNHFHDEPVQPLGNRQHSYREFLHGCARTYSRKGDSTCLAYEQDRLAMNLRQPRSMVNYTDTGFIKMKAPEEVQKVLTEFWKRNQENWHPERWPDGNTYTNHWAAPTYVVNVEDGGLRGRAKGVKQAVWDATQSAIEQWTGQDLTPTGMYGIRVYTEGAILNPHVDHLPLVFSAIINVAQDLDEPWPLELIGHDGLAHNVTMGPGDMVLIESHSIIHGRPFSMKGKYMANIFAHFEPIGHSKEYHGFDPKQAPLEEKKLTRGGHETASREKVPEYILPHSQEEEHYLAEQLATGMKARSLSTSLAHSLAAKGKTDELIELIEDQHSLVFAYDKNGWTPLHEGARSGSLDIVKYLVDKGADLNERTHHGTGGTPLYFAMEIHGKDSAVYKYLESAGAIRLEPIHL